MNKERGTGHLLTKRVGGGGNVAAYGGSLSLCDAAVQNIRLNCRLDKEKNKSDNCVAQVVKNTYRRRLSIRRQLLEMQQSSKQMRYVDGIHRLKPHSQWDSDISTLSMSKTDIKNLHSNALKELALKRDDFGSLPDLSFLDNISSNVSSDCDDEEDDEFIPRTSSLGSLKQFRERVEGGKSNLTTSTMTALPTLPNVISNDRNIKHTNVKLRPTSGYEEQSTKRRSCEDKSTTVSLDMDNNDGCRIPPSYRLRRRSRSLNDLRGILPSLQAQTQTKPQGQLGMEKLISRMKEKKLAPNKQ